MFQCNEYFESVQKLSTTNLINYVLIVIQQAFWDLQEMLKRENIITLEKAVKDL